MMETLAKVLLFIVTLALVAAAGIPLWGWAVAKLWLWFVVPLGLMPLSWAHAYGLATLIGLVSGHWLPDPKKTKEKIRVLVHAFGAPPAAVFFGWIVLHWM